MADKHSLNYEVRELKLGSSFTNNKASQYHTIKYDFKPASVDVNKMATVDVGTNNQVTVTVPHLDGAGIPQTVFKGNQRPYTKECVLIIDRDTGEITLEKLSSNIQVKKTRQESAQKPRPLTPITSELTNTTQRSTSRTRVATNRRTANNAGSASMAAQANNHNQQRFNGVAPKTQNMVRSPPRVKTSPPQAPWSAGGNSTLASLPMIGLDDAPASSPANERQAHAPHASHAPHMPNTHMPNAHMPNTHMPNAHVTNTNSHASNTHVPNSHMPNAHMPSMPNTHMPSMPNAHMPSMPNTHMPSMPNTHMPSSHAPAPPRPSPAPAPVPTQQRQDDSSSSSSSDSDSDSGSGSDSDDNDAAPQHSMPNGVSTNPALPTDVLNDDLCLSETGSDSD
ncbi:ell-associated factor Eaf [Colias croceus]|uniref:ell-associated factor Eaf n=1 Tax=Colias crocea TaxID=72248 RepID=UPI001E2815CA|nr:ell-associated factor Eaf [Colias croceus]